MGQDETKTGHRARLRGCFLADPPALSEAELLELLLTYAIPRQTWPPWRSTSWPGLAAWTRCWQPQWITWLARRALDNTALP
jgi:hypothetical protein